MRNCTKFWSENLTGGDHLEELRVDGKNIRMDFRKVGWDVVD
jgi:hypothetical protein